MPHNPITRRRFVRGSIRLAVVSPLIQLSPLDALAQSNQLGTAERRTLRAAADVIIPAQGQMPAASAVGAVRYSSGSPGRIKLAALLIDGLRAIEAHAATTHSARFDLVAADEQAEMLARVEKSDFFAALRDLVYGPTTRSLESRSCWATTSAPAAVARRRSSRSTRSAWRACGRWRRSIGR